MQDFSTMARSMQNIAAPGKMPMATMQGRGNIVAPQGGGGPIAPPGPGAPAAPGDQQQLMQIVMQIAQQIEAMTGQPATPEQIQAALSQVMGGAGADPAAAGMPPAPGAGGQQAQPMIPPMTSMKR
jgi:hypothetical protein